MNNSNQPLWQLVKACKARELKTKRESDKLLKVSNFWRDKKNEILEKIDKDKKKDSIEKSE